MSVDLREKPAPFAKTAKDAATEIIFTFNVLATGHPSIGF